MNQAEEQVAKIVKRALAKKNVSPIKAIRAKCLDCTCYQVTEVKLCPAKDCPLWMFRLGKNTTRKKRVFTDKQKKHLKNMLAENRRKRLG